MHSLFDKIFSKALILCYFFIGYVALTDRETPKCFTESIPFFRVDDAPESVYHEIKAFSAHHVRLIKSMPASHAVLHSEFRLIKKDLYLLFENTFFSPSVVAPHITIRSARAPPVC